MSITAFAQQNLSFGQGPQPVSPEINSDNTVTFRMAAPDAAKVQITGDFLPSQSIETEYGTFDIQGTVDMVKGADGIWTYTSDVLKPELYIYNMIVDGVKITDPLNVYTIRDINNLFNVFIIGGDRADLYKVNKVEHSMV